MASAAQITANQLNAQRSTGPRTEAGKAAVARNRLTHGLASSRFFLLPGEDQAEFESLRAALQQEFQPATATERFLVQQMLHAQWKLQRILRMEAGLLSGLPVEEVFETPPAADALLKLSRYEGAIERAWHRAHSELRALRRDAARREAQHVRTRQAEAAAQASERFNRMLEEATAIPEPPPGDSNPIAIAQPMPAHLERELAAHQRRDPLFDPSMDATQMSKELRRWFERAG
jgi:hypothetical protein